MKVLLTSLIILSFLGISVLSFVAMYHSNSHSDELCVTKTANGLDCPANPFAFADFHLNLFKGFSSAHLGNFLNIYFALVIFLLFGLILNLFRPSLLSVGRASCYQFERFFESFTPLTESKTSHWFSLHENSPTAR
ncbi:MAG: hypothetical protein A2649_02305 [Candidatus Yanofskybacteria bacterium RIFCSPHIGHO2_01_FULL_41_26]|uniref:Uncharacterized protein n=1 Tax=Candidatus Yanofskybacteria bacterium RIFCSPHIGHO2_01_FULL_41_26 TaxID=1802661 RepID=A0A1F8EDY7_9BACT|nr:MAG: hypothetical protein A2649_02305 [Candidatus Yanofskybacteria bacterium RIFCSPHIGHO2_01_FULL_41_26]